MHPRYYFALPRLFARLTGASAQRSEQNWLEAAVAGTLVHAVAYIFAARLLLAGRATWQQIGLLLPLALLVWAWWSVIIYANALLIRALRAGGFLRQSADRHLQSILIGVVTTIFACDLVTAGAWTRLVGLAWLGAVALNLAAAAILALMHAEPAR
ncbi:MAG TPA: hypothetical protein VK993_11500 [Chthoniobacterales bacterium]|nr:hypothetical protein [Chthoniobacterales bacterium]